MGELLKGKRILILEDNFIMALDLSQMIQKLGGTIAGPAARLAEGLALAQAGGLAAAILDVNLDRGETSLSLADELLAAHVPVVFATGYNSTALPDRFAGVPRLSKPFNERSVEEAMRGVIA